MGCHQITPMEPRASAEGPGAVKSLMVRWGLAGELPILPAGTLPHSSTCKGRTTVFQVTPTQKWSLMTRFTPVHVPRVDKTHFCRSVGLLTDTLWTRTPKETKPKRSINFPKRWDKIQNGCGVNKTMHFSLGKCCRWPWAGVWP